MEYISIPSIHPCSVALILYKVPGAYQRGFSAQVGGHHGRGANSSQGIITVTITHTPINQNLHCMSLNCWRKPEYPGETPKAQGEHANCKHSGRGRNLTHGSRDSRQTCWPLSPVHLHTIWTKLEYSVCTLFLSRALYHTHPRLHLICLKQHAMKMGNVLRQCVFKRLF